MLKRKEKIISSTALRYIKEITAPLQHLGIGHFTHDITFGRDKLTMLTDDKRIFDLYYDQQLPIICTNDTGRTLKPGIYLMKNIAYENNQLIDILSILDKKFNFLNSLIFIEHEKDCQHMFTLNSFLEEHLFLHKVINNLDSIKNFLVFYKQSLKEIIIEAKKPKHRISIINSSDFEKNLQNNHRPALSPVKLDGQLQLKHKETLQYLTLSVKQSKCLQLLLKSYSAKEIARDMNLSHRTIEHYIEHLKARLNCKNTKDLIASYASQII